MRPFFIFLFSLLFLAIGSKAQETIENFPLNNKINQNQQLDNNQIEDLSSYSDEPADLIRTTQDTLVQIPDHKKGKVDSLSDSATDKLAAWQDSTKLNPNLLVNGTLQNLTGKAQDSLHNILEKANSILPENEFVEKALPNELTNYSTQDKLQLDGQLPNGRLSPLQNEMGVTNLSIPGTDMDLDQLKVLDDLQPDATNLGIPSSTPDSGELEKQHVDQLIDSKAGKLDAVQELQQQSGDALGQADELKSMGEDIKEYGDLEQIKTSGYSLANEEAIKKMNELFDQHGDKLEKAQNLMSKLKKKYSYVPNSNDLSTARKANSLEGEPLKKRLSVGGNFNFERGNPLTLDLSPFVLYKINKEFYAGLSASYRFKISQENKSLNTHAEDVVGGSVLVRHKVYKEFFGYSEFEYRSSPVAYNSQTTFETVYKREWVPGMLLGIGKEMTLKGKLKGTVILTYDFLHSDNSFHKSPWNVKFGFSLDDLDLKNRRKELAENFLNSMHK